MPVNIQPDKFFFSPLPTSSVLTTDASKTRRRSQLEEQSSLRLLVPVFGQAPHQPPLGTVGHPHRSTSSSQATQQQVRLGEMRHHVSGDVSQQDGGYGANPCAFRQSVSCFGASVTGTPFKQSTCWEQTTPWRTAC